MCLTKIIEFNLFCHEANFVAVMIWLFVLSSLIGNYHYGETNGHNNDRVLLFYLCDILCDFSLAKTCMSTATSSSSTISTPVMVSMTSSIDTTPRRQPYSSRMIEICSRFSSIFSHI